MKLARVLFIAIAGALPVLAQTTEPSVGNPAVQHRCTSVVLDSETPMLPFRLIGPTCSRGTTSKLPDSCLPKGKGQPTQRSLLPAVAIATPVSGS